MNKQRRQQLLDKYPALTAPRPMSPALNTTIQGIVKAERIEAGIAGDEDLLNRVLFDPSLCPTLHDMLIRDLDELHAIQCEGWYNGVRAQYVTFRGETYDPHDPQSTSGTALLKWPHDCRIFVCRNNPDRLAANMLAGGPANNCNVQIAQDCRNLTFNDWPTRPLPIACGRVVLMYEICTSCEFVVSDAVDFNTRASVLEAQAALPEGARIDPGSPVPPRP
jgi:hypothetical protein